MQRNNGARFFPLIIIIVIVALVIAAVISIGRAIFNSGSDEDKAVETSQTDRARQSLLDSSTGRSVQMTVRGPIVAEENFKSYRISVSNSKRTLDAYNGYLEERSGGADLDNNTQAYEQFVYALDKANMTKGNGSADDENKQDVRGICAGGYVYEFTVLSGGNEVQRLWTSTCGGSKGTLGASKDQLSQLFQAQIPDSSTLIPFKQAPSLRL